MLTMNVTTAAMAESHKDIVIRGEETVVEVGFQFREDESLQSLENKIISLHRSMSSAQRKGNKHTLTVVNPQPGPRLLRRTSSSMSLQSSSVDSDASGPRSAKDGHLHPKERIFHGADGQWGYFADACLPQAKQVLATDKTRSLLERQQMMHML